QCSNDGGINIIEPFNGDAIIMYDPYSLKPMADGFDGKFYCDPKCKQRLKSYFSGKLPKIAFENNIAVETSNDDPYSRSTKQQKGRLYSRYCLANADDPYCVVLYYDPVTDNKQIYPQQLIYKDKCVAAK